MFSKNRKFIQTTQLACFLFNRARKELKDKGYSEVWLMYGLKGKLEYFHERIGLDKVLQPIFLIYSLFSKNVSKLPRRLLFSSKYPLLSCVISLSFLLIGFVQLAIAQPKNIVFFIGDGMGFGHVKAAGMYADGVEGSLSFEAFPYQAETTTLSANSSITDSAAAATAMATGFKVNNGVISMAYPGDMSELETLLEYFKNRGKSTGLVTTTYITHATPAAFGAHEPARDNLSEIGIDYLNQTRPNVLFGGGANGMSSVSAVQAGYTVVTDWSEMELLDTENITFVSGQFGNTHLPYEYEGLGSLPHLSEMTSKALEILDHDPDGFFLMVEGGRIDHAGHANDIERNVLETVEFSNAVEKAIDWAQQRTDTLILVTADHETGGLAVLQNNGQGNFPDISWSTTGHTEQNVPIYAWGENAELVNGVMDNTDLYKMVIADSDVGGAGGGGG